MPSLLALGGDTLATLPSTFSFAASVAAFQISFFVPTVNARQLRLEFRSAARGHGDGFGSRHAFPLAANVKKILPLRTCHARTPLNPLHTL